MRRRVRDECNPAHHRIATRQNSGAPCCTTESPSADSAIGNRYSGYTSPRPSPPACRSGACHRRAWPAELTVQHTPTRDPSGRLDTSGDHDCISLGSQASTSTTSWANQTTSFESKRFSRFKKFRNGHLGAAAEELFGAHLPEPQRNLSWSVWKFEDHQNHKIQAGLKRSRE